MNARPTTQQPQRSRGAARAGFALVGGETRLRDLRQQGSAKAMILPGPNGAPEVVFLNTSGGLTGGDRLDYALTLGAGCRATATTQTAERVYRSDGGAARLAVNLDLADGAHLDWLPQETILFDSANARRRTVITLAPGASCLMAETLVLGRAAMGETVRRIAFHDWRLIRRGETPLHLEALALEPARLGDNPAGLAGARALATLVMVSPGAADALGPARAALAEPGVAGAASAVAGRLVVRMMAGDGWPLRRQLARLLELLRRAPLPRVWQN
jgi:urease accessory protein